MEEVLYKGWTPEKEALYQSWLADCHTFAEQDLMMTLRDRLKYEGKRAIAQHRLRLAIATDEELEEVAKLEEQLREDGSAFVTYRLEELKKERAEIREKGIKRSEIESQMLSSAGNLINKGGR